MNCRKLSGFLAPLLYGALVLAIALPRLAQAAGPVDCDRACLKGQVDALLAAIVKHDATAVTIHADTPAIYNGKATRFADLPVWQGIDKFVFHQYVLDTVNRQAAFYGVASEENKRGIFFLRLVRDRAEVALVEITVGKRALDAVPGLIAPNTFYDYELPSAQRRTRAQLARLADDYFEALEQHDGSKIPIVEGCRRFEDGVLTSPNPYMLATCASFTHATYIDATSNRIYPVIDAARGLVLGQMVIKASRPPMMGPPPGGANAQPPYRPDAATGMVLTPGAYFTKPHDTIIHQLFKIVDGKIAEMQTYRLDCEYGWGGGWQGERGVVAAEAGARSAAGCGEPKEAAKPKELVKQTLGIQHLGLAVTDLDQTTRFFTQALGWKQVGERPDYPAKFVSNGESLFTLWQADRGASAFNRHTQIGLHHVAIRVPDEQSLAEMFERVAKYPGVVVEFAPEPLSGGPARHTIFHEPGGIRMELIWSP